MTLKCLDVSGAIFYLAGQKFVGEFSRHLEKCTDFSLERQLSKKQVECYIDKDNQECVENGSENNGKKNSFHDTGSGIITEEFVIFTSNKILYIHLAKVSTFAERVRTSPVALLGKANEKEMIYVRNFRLCKRTIMLETRRTQ